MGKIQIRKTREKKKAKIWATQIENNQEKPKLETQPEMQREAETHARNTNPKRKQSPKSKHSPKSTLKHKHKCQNRNTNVENGSAMEA